MYYPHLAVSSAAAAARPFPRSLRPSSSAPPSLLPSAPPSWRSRSRTVAAAADDDDGFFTVDLDPEDYADESESADDDSPWEGALVYRRDAAVHHLEHATTLERLGLGDLSSPESRARAAAMGMGAPDQPHTPVLVSLDVTSRRARCASTASCAQSSPSAASGVPSQHLKVYLPISPSC